MMSWFKTVYGWLMRAGIRFLFHYAAFFGFFAGTSNCPCCGQPACPAGAAGMGILAGLLALVMHRIQRRSPHTEKEISL